MLPLDQHRQLRLDALHAEDGWLNLTDRIEIEPGPQTVGSGENNAIRLASGPAELGVLLPGDAGFLFRSAGKTQPFQTKSDTPPQLRVPPFLLEIHTVDAQPALRVRDLTQPRQKKLCYFPVDPAWIIRARWHALPSARVQVIDQKGGAATNVTLTHTAHFSHGDLAITLLATHWKGGKPMFVIRDKTSGNETYAASRFLIGEDTSDTEITLDFNRAFTPPCGFTDFAICPLPPRENILPFRVEAGELYP